MSADPLKRLQERTVERVLDDERLRSNLYDDEASWLMDWAIARIMAPVPRVRNQQEAEALIEQRGRQVRQALRDINDLVGERGRLSLSEREARLRILLTRGEAGVLSTGSGEWDEAKAFLNDWDHLTNLEFIQRLARLVERNWREGQRERTGDLSQGHSGAPARGCLGGFLIPAFFLALLLVVGFALTQLVNRFPAQQPTAAPTTAPLSTTAADRRWYAIYFTDPQIPDVPELHRDGMDVRFIEFIAEAQSRLDIAVYDMDLVTVAEALMAASERGVRVRVVTDTDNAGEEAITLLRQGGIAVVEDGRSGLMHNKFAVADSRWVWTGSWNFAYRDSYNYNNHAVRFDAPELARNYEAVFTQMFEQQKFGPGRTPNIEARFAIQGIIIENYFAPEDGVAAKIVARILDARDSITFMAFSFTSDDIGNAMMDKARQGVAVRGVFETTGSLTQFSEYGRMLEMGLDVRQDGNPLLMHHKVIIIDESVVIFGSYNFSANAESDNDENVLIVHDPLFAAAFVDEFAKVYGQAKQ